jgi:RNA polymerase sigma-70 factor, ECF subfamily
MLKYAAGSAYRVADARPSESRERAARLWSSDAVSLRGRPRRPGPLGMLARSRSNPGDFADFYDHLAPNVLRFFARHTQNSHIAFDLMAETFAKAFERRGDYQGVREDQAAGWLWSIARHELSKYKRSRSVELAALTRLGLERPAPSDQELREVERLLALEGMVREHIPAALEALSADQKQVIQLRFYEGLSNEEIAARLAVSNDVVRARMSRALGVLRANRDLAAAVEILVDA